MHVSRNYRSLIGAVIVSSPVFCLVIPTAPVHLHPGRRISRLVFRFCVDVSYIA